MTSGDWMLIGRVAGSFGVRGEIKIAPYTDFPDRFKLLKQVFLGPAHVEMDVERARRHGGQVLLKLAGVDSRDDGDRLQGQEMFVPREDAVPLPEGHFYLEDVLGVEVRTEDGRILGPVTEVLRTGANDVFVVNSGRDAILVPVIRDAVVELDLRRRRLVVEPWVLRVDE